MFIESISVRENKDIYSCRQTLNQSQGNEIGLCLPNCITANLTGYSTRSKK